MTKEEFKEITDKYLTLDKELRSFSQQFITTVWEDETFNAAKQAMTHDDVGKLQKLRDDFDKAHEEWISGLQKLER